MDTKKVLFINVLMKNLVKVLFHRVQDKEITKSTEQKLDLNRIVN